jgi:ABC-type polysaccharide/polyol phosphate transport system ATPase subunit
MNVQTKIKKLYKNRKTQMKISDVKGLTVGNKIAIVIRNNSGRSTEVSGICSGVQVLDSGAVGVTVNGLGQWIWLEKNMTVTWSDN